MSVLKAALKKAMTGPETREIAQASLSLLPRGTTHRLFHPTPTKKIPHFLLSTPTCVHLEYEFDDSGEFIMGTKIKCRYTPSVGFLCNHHDTKLLGQKAAGKARDLHAEIVDGVIKTEAAALAGVAREVVGLKHPIQFVFGVRMTSDPDKVHVPEPTERVDLEPKLKKASHVNN